ncbi:vascular endothelial growth factor receptor 2-like, partial [Paramuricea clavata]
MLDVNKGIEEQVHKLPFIPEWEFPRKKITFVNDLGSGQFGVVWLAEAVGISSFHPREVLKERAGGGRFSFFLYKAKRNRLLNSREVTKVAVKSIKENADRKSLVDFQSELKILIHVGENENIVNILGACTKGKISNLWIIMEYCSNGNLREFLRSSRNIYDLDEDSLIPDPGQAIGPKTLVHFAWQVTKGMTFLISRK